jgi:trehalose/maltose hydrolase-like predicted phosphorylase
MSAREAEPWIVRFDGYDPADEGRRESLCTVGNGYLATRGAAPESAADAVHHPGTYLAGVYNRRRSELAGRSVEEESLVNVTNWLAVDFRIEGGPWFDIDGVELLDHHQDLDLRRGVLSRHLRFRDREGRTTAVSQRRFVAMDLRHVCALEMAVIAEDWSGSLDVRSGLDGTVENTLVERYRPFASDHLELRQAHEVSAESLLVEVGTNQSGIRIAMAARSTLWQHGERAHERSRHVWQRGSHLAHVISVDVGRGRPLTMEKVVTVFTDRDAGESDPAAQAQAWLPRLGRFDDLLDGHVLAWRDLWEGFVIDLADDPSALQVVRLHVFHILQTVSPHTVGLDVGVPARGLHGEAYRGHVLWDQLFALPLIELRLPLVARSVLLYRHRRLDQARLAARAAGHAGAMYPWRSASDGRDVTPTFQLNPRSGHWVPDTTHQQRHIGIAVAYNIWRYHQATADDEFLVRYGAEMLLEIARFWGSIARYDAGRDRYVIRGVMGPDEFHTGYLGAEQDGIDNNAYTNVMAAWVLCRALETLESLPAPVRRELQDTLDLGPAELERWADITRAMFVPFHGDGIISQFEGYEALDELDWSSYRERYGNVQRLDWILEAEGDTVNRYKVSKQADVLMLLYLLPPEELRTVFAQLGYPLSAEAVAANTGYYLDRTSHGSTLSTVVHACVLARVGHPRALELLVQALRADVADIQGATTSEGIHVAAMAGSVDLLQRCFSGLELRGDRLILEPYWRKALGDVAFTIRYRGQPLFLRIAQHRVEVVAGPAHDRPPIEVVCNGEVAELAPGSTVEFRI